MVGSAGAGKAATAAGAAEGRAVHIDIGADGEVPRAGEVPEGRGRFRLSRPVALALATAAVGMGTAIVIVVAVDRDSRSAGTG